MPHIVAMDTIWNQSSIHEQMGYLTEGASKRSGGKYLINSKRAPSATWRTTSCCRILLPVDDLMDMSKTGQSISQAINLMLASKVQIHWWVTFTHLILHIWRACITLNLCILCYFRFFLAIFFYFHFANCVVISCLWLSFYIVSTYFVSVLVNSATCFCQQTYFVHFLSIIFSLCMFHVFC